MYDKIIIIYNNYYKKNTHIYKSLYFVKYNSSKVVLNKICIYVYIICARALCS